MAGRRIFAAFLICASLISLVPASALAADALVLPEGLIRLRNYYAVGSADGMYDDSGNKRSFSELNLATLAANGVAASVPNVYDINSNGKFSFERYDGFLEYGYTDKVSIGVWFQHMNYRHRTNASLTQGAGWGMLTPGQQAGIQGAAQALDGYDLSSSGFGDTVFGVKHQALGDNEEPFRFSYTLGLRVPTGHVADPLNPADISLGGGQYDLGLWLTFDFEPAPGYFLSLQLKNEYPFPGSRKAVDPANAGKSLDVEFQPGFYSAAEVEALYKMEREKIDVSLGFMGIYEATGKERRQQYDASAGRYMGGLSPVAGTDTSLFVVSPTLRFTFFKMRLPFMAQLQYFQPVQGKNTQAISYFLLRFDIYIPTSRYHGNGDRRGEMVK